MRPRDLVLQVRHAKIDPERYALYQRAIRIAIVGNLVLALSKGAVAWISNSNAVLADAAISVADVLYTVFLAFGLAISQRPPDRDHPQGHARFEPLVSLVVGVTMGLTGYEVIRHSLADLFGPLAPIAPGWPTAVLVGSGLIKGMMYLTVRRIARRMHSPAIAATAADNLADVVTSVAALVGVWGSNWVSPLLDSIAGVVVSLWIFKTAYGVLRENLGYLTGQAADPEIIDRIVREARSVAGVQDVHQVVADYVGPQLRVDMHIDVDGTLPFSQIHDISDAVSRRVESIDEVDLVFIHVEPTEREVSTE
jgi:cation diffusion facilitator family transporter